MSPWIMKDMSLAPLDQQAGQEMEVSIRLAEGGKKNPALRYMLLLEWRHRSRKKQ